MDARRAFLVIWRMYHHIRWVTSDAGITLTCAPAVRFLTRVSRRLWSSSSWEWIWCRSRLGWTTSSAGSSLSWRLSHSPRPAGRGGKVEASVWMRMWCYKCFIPVVALSYYVAFCSWSWAACWQRCNNYTVLLVDQGAGVSDRKHAISWCCDR